MVADLIQEPGDQAIYTYDYGDGWEHEVVFEGRYPKERGKKYPVCLAGERRVRRRIAAASRVTTIVSRP